MWQEVMIINQEVLGLEQAEKIFTSWERWMKLCVTSLCDYVVIACDK